MSDLIPLDVLFGNPKNVAPALSPDGKLISYIAPDSGVMNVWIRTVGLKDDRPVTTDRNAGILMHTWSRDSGYIIYLQDKDGDENFHIFSVNVDSLKERDLTPYPGVQALPVMSHAKFPDEYLFTMNQRDRRFMDLYRLNLKTGEHTLEEENPGNIAEWIVDMDFKVRAIWDIRPDGGHRLLLREPDGSSRVVAEFPVEDEEIGPHGVVREGRFLYFSDSRGHDTSRLVEIDLETGDSTELASDENFDTGNPMLNAETFLAYAVSVYGERKDWRILDPAVKPVFEEAMKIQEGELAMLRPDKAQKRWLAAFTKDDGPVSYHIMDRDTHETTFLFHHRPELENMTLAKMESHSFPSRDGLTLHAYLTLPHGLPRENLPMVLNVHGGPAHRDTWGYNPEAQWFANRGYACLQVNFRGSTGYGKRFLRAGDREWGGKMHDDLIDAVGWAVASGFADPKRIAIYGASYGGYAALAGATFSPEVFRCSVSMCGPSNLLTFLNSIPPYWEAHKQEIYTRVGHPEKDEELMRLRSPLFHLDKIQCPMLIAQGANDPRVVQAESEQIVSALQEKGHPVEYLLFEDEGHGFAKEENRLSFYRAVDRFLARHLGGRCEE
jgi:dipeptidyl aminopeptidase/acylaminoacyl peptidase